MDYTNHYHLPQWAETDRIMMEDFNRMCANIDTMISAAITENTEALSDYKSANDAAVAKKAEQSALDSGISAAEERITALEQGVALVRLGVVTTTETNQTVTIDLQNVDMSAYTALVVFVGAPLVNGNFGKLYLTINESNLLLLKVYDSDSGTIMAWMQKAGSKVVGCALSGSSASSSTDSKGGSSTTAWEEIQSVGVSGTSGAGMLCAFYALKA